MFSIDQNSHSLWDCLPKLQALSAKGIATSHFIEENDVAFTHLGADLAGNNLRLARERFHRSGGADWGAALFYSEFLGRLPVEIRHWEPYTGQKTNVLAKELGRSVDDLYDEFSPSDNWQLIGPSYVGDREHHRTIGDLTAGQTAPFLLELLAKARQNTLESFPQADSQRRTNEWFDQEQSRVEALLGRPDTRLVDLYRDWLGQYLRGSSVSLGKTSDFFSVNGGHLSPLDVFVRDYATASRLYNQAVEEAAVGLRPLRLSDGELPFFASYEHEGRQVRSSVFLEDQSIRISQRRFALKPGGALPLDELGSAGICCLAGKAALLVIQARTGQAGQGLALPYRGSMYMPAAYRLQQLLQQHGMIQREIRPIVRVRFHFLDRLRSCETIICLPPHLRGYFGKSEIPASELGEHHEQIASEAATRLEKFKDASYRRQWQQETMSELAAEIEAMERRRRELAKSDPKGSEVRKIWQDTKLRKIEMLDALLHQISSDYQARDLDYWDSRGALMPWSIALGGLDFYNAMVAQAEIYEEVPA